MRFGNHSNGGGRVTVESYLLLRDRSNGGKFRSEKTGKAQEESNEESNKKDIQEETCKEGVCFEEEKVAKPSQDKLLLGIADMIEATVLLL